MKPTSPLTTKPKNKAQLKFLPTLVTNTNCSSKASTMPTTATSSTSTFTAPNTAQLPALALSKTTSQSQPWKVRRLLIPPNLAAVSLSTQKLPASTKTDEQHPRRLLIMRTSAGP